MVAFKWKGEEATNGKKHAKREPFKLRETTKWKRVRESQRESECGKINVNQFIVSFWILLLVIAAGSKVDFDIYFN